MRERTLVAVILHLKGFDGSSESSECVDHQTRNSLAASMYFVSPPRRARAHESRRRLMRAPDSDMKYCRKSRSSDPEFDV